MSGCLTSATRTRRIIIAAAPGRPPRSWAAAAVLLHLARRTAGFAEWVQVRAETAAIELEASQEKP